MEDMTLYFDMLLETRGKGRAAERHGTSSVWFSQGEEQP